jgi:stalled ribosome rescue protein Dom34
LKKHLIYFITALAWINFSQSTLAQEPDSEAELSEEQKVDLLCGCVSTFMDDMHPQIQTMIRDMVAIGKEEAEQNFTEYLMEHPEEMEEILKDSKALENFDGSMANIEGCEDLNTILSDTKMEESSMTLEELEAEINSRDDCEFAAIFFRLGKQ